MLKEKWHEVINNYVGSMIHKTSEIFSKNLENDVCKRKSRPAAKKDDVTFRFPNVSGLIY